MQRKVAFYTLGCKVNSAETDVLAAAFQERDDYKIVDFEDKSDIYLINTCTVTHQADSQCRQIIRRARRNSPGAVIAVIGCYAQADSEKAASIQGVDFVLGTRERFSIFELLENNSCQNGPVIRTGLEKDPFLPENNLSYDTSRTRAFLKVQDGCSYKCSYCIIPKVRGESIGRGRHEILKRVTEIRDKGFREIVLTAINLGEYWDGANYRLINLLKDICDIPDIPRIRLSSIEPNCFTEEILEFAASSSTICPHFHIPLQSGSDATLKRMRRKYSTAKYERVIENIAKYLPDASIGADVIVGFPGETEDHFNETYDFIEKLPVTYLHVFRYSPRTGTEAADFGETIHSQISQARSRRLITLGNKKKARFLRDQVGNTAETLFESKEFETGYEGFTANYSRVRCNEKGLANQIKRVRITDVNGGILDASVIN